MYDECYYEQVAEELRLFGPRPGLWAKSFAEANGDEAKAKALYLRYRAEQIEHEVNAELELTKQAEAEKQREKWQQDEIQRKLKLSSRIGFIVLVLGLITIFLHLLLAFLRDFLVNP